MRVISSGWIVVLLELEQVAGNGGAHDVNQSTSSRIGGGWEEDSKMCALTRSSAGRDEVDGPGGHDEQLAQWKERKSA